MAGPMAAVLLYDACKDVIGRCCLLALLLWDSKKWCPALHLQVTEEVIIIISRFGLSKQVQYEG